MRGSVRDGAQNQAGSLAIRGRVVTPDAVWDGGTILVESGEIRAVSREPLAADAVVELPDHYLVPGFVDLQVNGGFGVDAVDRPGRLGELSAALPATGVTSYLPTLVTLPLGRYPAVIGGLDLDPDRGAVPLGLHLEGPFISPEKRGAHAAEAVAEPDPDALAELLDAGPVEMVTLAPEMPGAGALIELAASRGTVASLGHSAASFEEALSGFESGAAGVTHLFNAMSPLHHRDPGLPGAAMLKTADSAPRCGMVADGRHVHPEMVRLAFERLGPDRMYLVTDAMAAAGMGPGEYELAGRTVSMRDGIPRLEDGTLAGSVLTMDEAIRNALEFAGCSLPEAVRMATATPAALIGAAKKGRLTPGSDADVVALSPDLLVEAAWVGGRLVYERDVQSTRDGDQRAVVIREGSKPPALDEMGTGDLLRAMNRADAAVAPAVEAAVPDIERVVERARETVAGGGRVIYAGAGTSGRLAVADAAECSPTFGVAPGTFTSVMAGGLEALYEEAAEAEDGAAEGRRAIRELNVGAGDLVVGVSASGATPFTLAAQLEARERRAATACIVNLAGSDMARNADLPVEIATGAEILPGSTRLKAGTAQKLVLNMISTATLAGLGYVHGDMMVGMRPYNHKLRGRAESMVREITGCSEPEAASALQSTEYDIRGAVLLVDGVTSAHEAARLLRLVEGDLRRAREYAPQSETTNN
ncbi:N-acetylglucosamine-6-phosphate deacetylase [Rubrobacter aplysinae]|uniref:N-acetylglucosamine-6-phosphate deacetylase n=1 Tax=Rubrobacter aplysinae TaxID=909625 RepID=UPI00128E0FFF|nr:N-acetylglucosamine-6-phosphate deacetylase [Rubrobacter aplysinae]